MHRITLVSVLLIALVPGCRSRTAAPAPEPSRSGALVPNPAPAAKPALAAKPAPVSRATPADEPSWELQASGVEVGLRGLSAVSRNVAWVGGEKGVILRTTDGGRTWSRTNPPPGAEEMDFRDIHAFDAESAVALHAGTRSRIFKTTDGGESWTQTWPTDRRETFLNGVAFWNRDHGVAFGDPVDQGVVILLTDDGGNTWRPAPAEGIPPLVPGEIAFAASGTSIRTLGDKHAWIGLGGAGARVMSTIDGGQSWKISPTPLVSGCRSCGVFSMAFRDEQYGVAVGGDYVNHAAAEKNAAVTPDGGRNWSLLVNAPPGGYRSCVAYRPGTSPGEFVTVGVGGCDWSSDGGMSWAAFGDQGFHAVAFTPDGASGWAAGTAGRIAALRMPASNR